MPQWHGPFPPAGGRRESLGFDLRYKRAPDAPRLSRSGQGQGANRKEAGVECSLLVISGCPLPGSEGKMEEELITRHKKDPLATLAEEAKPPRNSRVKDNPPVPRSVLQNFGGQKHLDGDGQTSKAKHHILHVMVSQNGCGDCGIETEAEVKRQGQLSFPNQDEARAPSRKESQPLPSRSGRASY